MSKCPQKRTPEFKLKVALESLKGDQAITKLASEYGIHPRQITRWRDQLLVEGKDIFVHKATQKSSNPEPDRKELLHIIDKLSLELEFLKKKLKRSE